MSPNKALFVAVGVSLSVLLSVPGGAVGKGQDPPVNVTPPSIAGTPSVGQTLVGSVGTWSGVAIKYSFQWMRCAASGKDCIPLTTASASTYVVSAEEENHTIRLLVVGTNHRGSASAIADATGVVAAPSTAPATSPSKLIIASVTQTSASLVWSAADTSAAILGYEIYVEKQRVGHTGSTEFVVSELACGSTYTFDVFAVYERGQRSAPATTAGTTAPCTDSTAPAAPTTDSTAPAAPTGLAARGTTTTLILTWEPARDDVKVVGYGVYVEDVLRASTTDTAYTVADLSCGRDYAIAVDAFDAAGNRSARASLSAVTAACASASPIYWGAYMDGDETYNHYFGGSWGDAPWDSNTWQRFEANAGKKVSIVHWGLSPPWRREFRRWEGTFELVRSAGALNAVAMDTGSVPLLEIARGDHDASIRTWMRQAASYGHPFFLLLNVEMNGVWLPYSVGVNGNTAQDFIAAWRRFHDISRQEGATNVTWVWCPNVDPLNRFTPYQQIYPGHGYVDWTCLNGFNQDGRSSFSWLYSSSYKKLLEIAPDKPVMISQIGSVEGGSGKAAWISDVLTTQLPQNFPQIKAFLWFNWRIWENERWWEWPIESSSSAQSAFTKGIGSSYYLAGGAFGNLPRGSTIPVP